MSEILQRARLVYLSNSDVIKGTYDERFEVGEIRKELTKDNKITYVIDIDEEVIKEMADKYEYVTETIFPGMDFDDGYYYKSEKVPYFIRMRVPDPRRGDIDKLLKKFGLEYYDAFTFMLKLGGAYADNWRVEEIK